MRTATTADNRIQRPWAVAHRPALIVLAMVLAGCSSHDRPRPIAEVPLRPTTIEYAKDLRYDLAYPATARPPYPIVVLIHGGALTTGNRRDAHLATVAAALRARGYATASIDYTLGSEIPNLLKAFRARTGVPYECDPAASAAGTESADDIGGPGRPCLVYLRAIDRATDDVAAAVAAIAEHAETLSLDPNRLVLYGESAGSTLALQFGLTTARDHGVTAVAGAASGVRVRDDADLEMPLLLITYAADLPNPSIADAAPPDQSEAVRADAERLKAIGAPVELLTFPGSGHLAERGSRDFSALIERLVDFFSTNGAPPRI